MTEAILAREQTTDHADRFVLTVALHHRFDSQGAGVAGQCARAAAEHRTAPGHVIELHHPLGDVERVVIGERDDPGAETDVTAHLAGRRQEHLRRGDRLPTARVVLAAPEFLEAKPVEVRDEVDVSLEQQGGMLAERMVRGEEGAELQSSHSATLENWTCRLVTRAGNLAVPSGT